jgi:hypothetical protein
MIGKLLTAGAIPNPPKGRETTPTTSRWVPVYLFVIDTSAPSVQSQLLNVLKHISSFITKKPNFHNISKSDQTIVFVLFVLKGCCVVFEITDERVLR